MELRHLRAFLVLADTLHFAHAAEQLGVSPPTLTVQIQELEHALQARLFHRTKRSVSLSAAGEAFRSEAAATLAQFEQAVQVGQRAGRGQLGHIRIGYVASASFAGVLQEHMARYRRQWPEVLLTLEEAPMETLPQQLLDGNVDIALVRLPLTLPPGLDSHTLLRDPFCLALAADHPLAERNGPLPLSALKQESFVLPEQDIGLREVARRGRFTPRISVVPGSLLAVLTHVSLGVGVAVVPSVVTDVIQLPNLVYRPLAGAAIYSEVAALSRRFERDPAVQHLIRQLHDTPLRQLPAP